MKVSPYLTFNGNCEEAFKFYEQCLGGKILFMMKNAGSPMEDKVASESLDKILHATLSVGTTLLMASDVPPDQYQAPQGISVSLEMADATEAERIYHALAEGGTVQCPIQETFWATRFGMAVDRFGIPWMINCSKTP